MVLLNFYRHCYDKTINRHPCVHYSSRILSSYYDFGGSRIPNILLAFVWGLRYSFGVEADYNIDSWRRLFNWHYQWRLSNSGAPVPFATWSGGQTRGFVYTFVYCDFVNYSLLLPHHRKLHFREADWPSLQSDRSDIDRYILDRLLDLLYNHSRRLSAA